jgi:hypothetical protein
MEMRTNIELRKMTLVFLPAVDRSNGAKERQRILWERTIAGEELEKVKASEYSQRRRD